MNPPRNPDLCKVMVTGGAGYVGARLVPALLADGYDVTVLDLYLYGRDVLAGARTGGPGQGRLVEIQGDMRDPAAVTRALEGADSVVHLACISNDPSFELDPNLGRSINYESMPFLVEEAKRQGIRRFVYASSSSVYGIKAEERVTEDLAPEPLTDYSKFKVMGEKICMDAAGDGFTVVCVRPATVCGFSPRQRLDVIVNLLTGHAWYKGRILVTGGSQYRPNIHIEDMVDVYRLLLSAPDAKVQGKVYNAGHRNRTVQEIAEGVRSVLADRPVELVVQPTNDPRSYRLDSEFLAQDLGFRPRYSIEDAVRDLSRAFADGRCPEAPDHPRYWNIRTMQQAGLR